MSRGRRESFPGGLHPRKQARMFQAQNFSIINRHHIRKEPTQAMWPAAIHTRKAAFLSPWECGDGRGCVCV